MPPCCHESTHASPGILSSSPRLSEKLDVDQQRRMLPHMNGHAPLNPHISFVCPMAGDSMSTSADNAVTIVATTCHSRRRAIVSCSKKNRCRLLHGAWTGHRQ